LLLCPSIVFISSPDPEDASSSIKFKVAFGADKIEA